MESTQKLVLDHIAKAIEDEGIEVIGVTSYGDLSQFAQQQSRASAFILSIDDEEFTPGPELDPAVRALVGVIGRRIAEALFGQVGKGFLRGVAGLRPLVPGE